MDQPRMIITSGLDALKLAKKQELADRVEQAVDMCECCQLALAASTKLGHTEEFFNKCHGEGGRFCGGPGGKGGPGTHRPAPIDYQKRAGLPATVRAIQPRESKAVRDVTTGPIRAYLYGGASVGGLARYGTPRLRKLAKADYSKFSTKDLGGLKTLLQVDQRRTNTFHTISWLTLNPVGIGYSNWRAKRAPKEIKRIESELSKRGAKVAASVQDAIQFADQTLPSLAEEIAIAKKQIESNNTPKVGTVSDADRKDIASWLSAITSDPEAGLTAQMVKDIQKSIK